MFPVKMRLIEATTNQDFGKGVGNLLTTLLKSTTEPASMFSAEKMTAIAALLSAVAWPAVAIVFIVAFKPDLKRLATHVTEFKAFGIEAKLESELKQAAADADKIENKSGAPTTREIARSEKIDDLTSANDLDFIRAQVAELATSYERTRASMASGDERTRAMEAIVAKMRAIGRAASRFRYELTTSPSPGRRLQAIASLQVLPDFDLVIWLAERPKNERPFIAYHALVALNVAAASPLAGANHRNLAEALRIAKESSLPSDSDRQQQLIQLEVAISRLPNG